MRRPTDRVVAHSAQATAPTDLTLNTYQTPPIKRLDRSVHKYIHALSYVAVIENGGVIAAQMETVYPASASALARGRRLRRAEPRLRHRTLPVTFAEIKVLNARIRYLVVNVTSPLNLFHQISGGSHGSP